MSTELETLILNPVEFVPALPEIDLNDLGLEISAHGLDYGESSMQVTRVREAISEGVTDAHWPPVDCTVPLIARATDTLPVADPLHRLEAWVGEVQGRRSGWIRRDFSTDAGVAGSVGCPVDMAGLTPAQGWSFTHNEVAPDIVLKLSRYPIWYATVEIEAGSASGSGVRDLQLEIAELLGTAPGLIRVVVKNEGTEDWRGCLVSIECDDYSADATALPKYEAQKLTPKGGAEVKEVSGAKVVKCPPLTSGWQTVLYSEIAGEGHMTHVGTRRMAFRIDDVSTLLDDVQWKLEWRALGAANWIQTMEGSTPLIVSSPVVGGYQVIDLGECRPPMAISGTQRWEFRLQVRSLTSSGVQPLIRDVYPASTEQWMRVADASENPIDGEPTKAPGSAANQAGIGTVAWSNVNSVKVRDGSYATCALPALSAISNYLEASNFGFAIPAGATIRGVQATVYRKSFANIRDYEVKLVKSGVVEGSNMALPSIWAGFSSGATPPGEYGGRESLWGLSLIPAVVNAANFGIAIAAQLKTGSSGTGEVDAITLTVFYTEGANENRICFASRSVEFSDSGVRRQHVTDEVWGDLVPDGFLPYSPPPGQSGQPVRMLIVPTVGDFDTRADSATLKPNAKVFYRPGYLFAREAA
jgi:hypothetical protein